MQTNTKNEATMLLSRLPLTYFIAAFSVGLLFCYVSTPPPQVVVKFPSPANAGQVVYRDKSDTCYVFKAEKKECPLDTSKVKEQPITEDFLVRKNRNVPNEMKQGDQSAQHQARRNIYFN